MERAVHSGTLSDVVFARAVHDDDADIRALLRRVPMRGDLQMGFGREPSCFACPEPAGCAERLLVARRDGRLVGVGAWTVREAWLGGQRSRVGYLHGLRLEPGLKGSLRVLREGYAFLATEIQGVDASLWFTSIDAANTRARRVLESRLTGLPHYTAAADYLTRVFAVPARAGARARCGTGSGIGRGIGSREEITDFLNREAARHDLALTWDDARWQALERSGYSEKDVVVVLDGGDLVAVAGVWDQRAWRQVIIHGYPRWMRIARPLYDRVGSLFGWPPLPKVGKAAPLGQIFPFAVAEGCEDALPRLMRGVEAVARRRGIDWLALGLDATAPLWRFMKSSAVSYPTVFYQVHGNGFPPMGAQTLARPIRPECATL